MIITSIYVNEKDLIKISI